MPILGRADKHGMNSHTVEPVERGACSFVARPLMGGTPDGQRCPRRAGDRVRLVARSAGATGILHRLVRFVTEVLAPAPVAGGLLVLVAWHSSANVADALRLAVLAALFAAIVPMVYILAACVSVESRTGTWVFDTNVLVRY